MPNQKVPRLKGVLWWRGRGSAKIIAGRAVGILRLIVFSKGDNSGDEDTMEKKVFSEGGGK